LPHCVDAREADTISVKTREAFGCVVLSDVEAHPAAAIAEHHATVVSLDDQRTECLQQRVTIRREVLIRVRAMIRVDNECSPRLAIRELQHVPHVSGGSFNRLLEVGRIEWSHVTNFTAVPHPVGKNGDVIITGRNRHALREHANRADALLPLVVGLLKSLLEFAHLQEALDPRHNCRERGNHRGGEHAQVFQPIRDVQVPSASL